MDNAGLLIDYCEKKLIRNNLFSDYMKQNPCFILAELNSSLLNNELKDIKKNISYMLIYQSVRIKKLMEEYQRLDLPDTQVVGLKGFFISLPYWPPDKIRMFVDTDLFAKTSNGFNLCKLLYKKGYYFNSWDIPRYWTRVLAGKSYFRKKLHVTLIKESFRIELHGNLSHLYRGYGLSFNNDRMVEESISKSHANFLYRILSPIDNILFLMYHTIKHISYVELENAVLSINMQKFYDVVQIIDNEEINWDIFMERTSEYNLYPYVALFLKMFTDIFPNIIPQKVLEKTLRAVTSVDFHWKKLFDDVMKIDTPNLILGNYSSVPVIYDAYHSALLSDSPKVKVQIWKECIANEMQ